MKAYKGDLEITNQNAEQFKDITSVGGDLYINSDVKLEASALTSVGGSLYINSGVKLETAALTGLNYISVDRSLFVIESQHVVAGVTLMQGYNAIGVSEGILKRGDCFVAKQDEFTAHGGTVKKAMEDLKFKVTAETLRNSPIHADTIINAAYYRAVTGACEFGVNNFIKQHALKEEYTAKELLPILQGNDAWGLSKLKFLIKF